MMKILILTIILLTLESVMSVSADSFYLYQTKAEEDDVE